MNKSIIFILFISVLLLSGANECDLSSLSKADIDKVIVCGAPYMRHASGCCLDKNDNSICDEDETSSLDDNIDEIIKDALKDELDSDNGKNCPEVTDVILVEDAAKPRVGQTSQFMAFFSDQDEDLKAVKIEVTHPNGVVQAPYMFLEGLEKGVKMIDVVPSSSGWMTVNVTVSDSRWCQSYLWKKFYVSPKETTTTTTPTNNYIPPSSKDDDYVLPTPEPEPAPSGLSTLFSDDFARPSLGGDWIVSGSGSSIDLNDGKVELGPYVSYPGKTLSPDAAFLNGDDGVEFKVKVALPDNLPQEEACADADPVTGEGSHGGANVLINIVNTNTGVSWARLNIVRGYCGSQLNTRTGNFIMYKIGTGHLIPYYEWPAWETYDDGFNEYSFKINTDGTSEWRKNGNLKTKNTQKTFPKEGFTIQISGNGNEQTPVYIDDVNVIG